MVGSSKTIKDKMTEPEVAEKRTGHEVGGGRVLEVVGRESRRSNLLENLVLVCGRQVAES